MSEFFAPGLKRMKRHNGRIDLYWVADEKLVQKGFRPRTQRLFGEWPSADIAARCQILQAEMLEWAAGVDSGHNSAPPGSLEWLCRAFETHAESPFHGLRQDTRTFYSRYIRHILLVGGGAYLSDITGRDVRRWHREWLAASGERSAYGCIQTLRRVVNYGCELRNADAIELAQVLSKTEFSVPKGRKKRPSYEQIVAFRQAAQSAGRPSLALALTLQFDLGLRQKDVIGEWVSRGNGVGGWQWGLTWSHIDEHLILRKPTSKSNGAETAEHDLKLYPDLLATLPSRGVGPVVLDERTGRPWSKSHFSRTF